MADIYAKGDPDKALGVDVKATDDRSETPAPVLLEPHAVTEWFTSAPHNGAALRLLCLQQPLELDEASFRTRMPFRRITVEHGVWDPEACLAITHHRAGGCAAFLDEPWRVVMQTPLVAGPCFSLVLSRRGATVKGIYIYNDPSFSPAALLPQETIRSSWRSTGLQIVSLPQAIARAHASYIWHHVYTIVDAIQHIENELIGASIQTDYTTHTVLSEISRRLQYHMTALMDLERRARFHAQILDAIASVTSTWTRMHIAKDDQSPWPPLLALRSQSAPWTYELETLARRMESARAAVNTILHQRDAQLNLQIAESSYNMAVASFQDAASMKSLAILTMVFLPGTAVASFFSMSMFDWDAGSGGQLASKWLWVFFAVAVPLTAVVLGTWYVWGSQQEKAAKARFGNPPTQPDPYDGVPDGTIPTDWGSKEG